jgi:POT family proton-dependent oligopeptide transporter
MGINIGAAAAPLLTGWLAFEFGWSWGFGVAGIGMMAGLLARMTSVERVGEELTDPAAAMSNYQDVFQLMGLIAISVAVVLLILSPFLKKLMHLDKSIAAEEFAGGVVEPE